MSLDPIFSEQLTTASVANLPPDPHKRDLSLAEMQGLDDAIRIIKKARYGVCGGASALWFILNRAADYLDAQMKDALRGGAQ